MPRVIGFGSRSSSHRIGLVLMTTLTVAGLASRAEARGGARPSSDGRSASASQEGRASGPGKIAVFTFDGDEATSVHKHVVMALSNQGLRVDTSLRPVQTAEEFRDMGATLNLAAYVHGHIKDLPGDKAEATITVRSGVTGRPIATMKLAGYRRGLRFDVEEKLWKNVGKAILHACKEATKPRRPVNAPTRIEAGTPL
jgi:hypothetical protein